MGARVAERGVGRRGRAGWWGLALGLVFAAGPVGLSRGAETPPAVVHGAGEGRFVVIAPQGPEGVLLAQLGEQAWGRWREPLGLPLRLDSGIVVRLIPGESGAEGTRGWTVLSQPGGVVTVRIQLGGEGGSARERLWLRALAEGALRRRAMLSGISPGVVRVPSWLVVGAAEDVLVARRPALLDDWRAGRRGEGVAPALRGVLLGGDAAGESSSAFALWWWLREASGRSGAWGRFLPALLAGEAPGAALAREFSALVPPGAEAREWELAWQVASAALAHGSALPVMEPGESRRRLEVLARMVITDPVSRTERVLPAWGEWATRDLGWVTEERRRRAQVLLADFDRHHPFFRNAAGSLGRAWLALDEGREDAWRSASAEWARDFAEGLELEAASSRLLAR